MRDLESAYILSNLTNTDLLLKFRKEFPLHTFTKPEYASLQAYAAFIATPKEWGGDFDNLVLLKATGIARVQMLVVAEDGTIPEPYDSAEGIDAQGRILRIVFHPKHCDLAVPLSDEESSSEEELEVESSSSEEEDVSSEEEGSSSEEDEEDSSATSGGGQ